MSGSCCLTCATAEATSRSKTPAPSTPRRPSTHLVPTVPVMIGCIEYAGVKPSATRSGPPNAWRRCSSTSLEPLPAHTWSAVTATPVAGSDRPPGPRAAGRTRGPGSGSDPMPPRPRTRRSRRRHPGARRTSSRWCSGQPPRPAGVHRRAFVPAGQGAADRSGSCSCSAPVSEARRDGLAVGGRSSAPASVTTWWATSRRAACV